MRWTLLPLVLALTVCSAPPQKKEKAEPRVHWKGSGMNGAVAAGGPDSSGVDAAIEIMKAGGNAADAAAATILVLSVIDPNSFCFGGEVPIIVYDAKRDVVEVVAGQGVAPRLATLEFYRKNKGGRVPGNNDPTTAAVPAVVDALVTLLERYGTMTFTEVSKPMLRILDAGDQGWHKDLARTVRRLVAAERESKERVRGLRLVSDCFYRGPVARELDAWSREHGGLLRYTDLATHVTRIEEPLSIEYRGHVIHKCNTWTQGPWLLQAMRLAEGFDVKAMGHNSADHLHMVVESMKLALADRDTYYADPLFEDVPMKNLLSEEYTKLRRKLIDIKKASQELQPGDPVKMKALLGIEPRDYKVPAGKVSDTTTCITADKWGNVVSATPSGWGGVMAGGTGVRLGSRLRSLNTWEGHPNCIEPGKRPRITLTPTMVMREGKPVFAVSVLGGDDQDQATFQILLNHLEFGMAPAEAVTAPRVATRHHWGSFNQPPPRLGEMSAYKSIGEETINALRGLGHKVSVVNPPLGCPVAVEIDRKTGLLKAAGDPKAGRFAAAY